MVAHVAHSMGDQQDYAKEGETLQGPIKRVRGVVIPKTSKRKKIFHAFDAISNAEKKPPRSH